MSIIANMKKLDKGSFEGRLKTATMNQPLKLLSIEHDEFESTRPDFKVKIGSFEIGAGWNKISENENEYVSVQLDAPEFPAPIYANLIQKKDGYVLIWSRQS